VTAELTSERANGLKLDSDRNLLDRQNKDLKAKLSELEMALKTRNKAAMQALEAKIANLEEQLEVESRYKEGGGGGRDVKIRGGRYNWRALEGA